MNLHYVEIAYAIWNGVVFLVYGFDKWKAKRKWWRIPESFLLLCAYFFGALGAIFGMVIFNHKSKKMKFRLLVPLAVVVNYLLYVWLV